MTAIFRIFQKIKLAKVHFGGKKLGDESEKREYDVVINWGMIVGVVKTLEK